MPRHGLKKIGNHNRFFSTPEAVGTTDPDICTLKVRLEPCWLNHTGKLNWRTKLKYYDGGDWSNQAGLTGECQVNQLHGWRNPGMGESVSADLADKACWRKQELKWPLFFTAYVGMSFLLIHFGFRLQSSTAFTTATSPSR